MDKEKQIEEMARIIDDNHGFIVSSVETAEAIYNADYRKASDVAMEIFEEIDKMLDPYGKWLKILRLGEYAELKKKYTQEK